MACCLPIAENLGMPRSTISTVFTKWKLSSCITTKKPGHRPQKLSNEAVHNLAHDIDQEQHQTLVTFAGRYEMSHNTIRTYIRRLGFGNRVVVRKPYLNSMHKTIKLTFAHKFVHWTVEDWYKVIWTNESSFELRKNS